MVKQVLETVENFKRYNQKLKDLKRKFEGAFKDEEETVDNYNEIGETADGLNYESAGRMLRDMARDEDRHARNFKRLMREVDGIIAANEKEIGRLEEKERKERKKKLEEVHRRCAELPRGECPPRYRRR